MKATHKIHSDKGYVHITFEGSITLPELGAHIQTVWSDKAWRTHFGGIIDCSAATLDISDVEIQELTKGMMKDPRCSFAKWAFVVSTAADFAKFRQVNHVVEVKSNLRIFFDLRSAKGWLLAKEKKSAR